MPNRSPLSPVPHDRAARDAAYIKFLHTARVAWVPGCAELARAAFDAGWTAAVAERPAPTPRRRSAVRCYCIEEDCPKVHGCLTCRRPLTECRGHLST